MTTPTDIPIHTILGAGGVIADGLARQLLQNHHSVRLVSRRGMTMPGAETHIADISVPQQALQAIQGSHIVYCCIGLKYDYSIWRRQWPPIMDNMIAACKKTQARLVFFDNVYMYGKVDGPMTEDTPYDPDSRKGDLRARIATQLMSEVRKGNITAMIARAADFYGPGADKTSIPNLLVFQRLLQNKKAQWLADTKVKHSFTYTEDAIKGLYLLAQNEEAWNQAWHLPTASNPLTGAEFISQAAAALGKPAASFTLAPWMIRLGGLFDTTTKELNEMLYQYRYDYIFDSSKFEKAFAYQPVSYTEGIKFTAGR